MPTIFSVSSEADLNADIATINGAPSGAYQLDFTGNILETADVEAINLQKGVSLTIDGDGHALDGAAQHRGLFVYSGSVTLEDLTLQNMVAKGGAGGMAGGGGGAGLGGGLFVADDTIDGAATAGAVTLDNVTFSNDSAVGGAGGDGLGSQTYGVGGGGGGLGGAGGVGGIGGTAGGGGTDGGGGGGGGIGLGAAGGGPSQSGDAGILGTGGAANGGGAEGGGGGGGGPEGPGHQTIGGGGGGIHAVGSGDGGDGGNGGYGGGGGGEGGGVSSAGAGGFGGGGGGGAFSDELQGGGGQGGFGGGGGGADNGDGAGGADGGFGGGNGSAHGGEGDSSTEVGGGGLGAGGDIFVQQGASLTIEGGTLNNGTVTAGDGASGGGQGQAFGAGIFLQGNETVTFGASGGAGSLTAIDGDIADQTGSGGVGANSGAGEVVIAGAGRVALGGDDTYSGGTLVEGGATLSISAADNLGSGAVALDKGATLDLKASLEVVNAIAMTGAATLDVAAGASVGLAGLADGASPGALILTGGGVLTLSPFNAIYSGGTTIEDASTLAVGKEAGTGPIAFGPGGGEIEQLNAHGVGNLVEGFGFGDSIETLSLGTASTDTVSVAGDGGGEETVTIDASGSIASSFVLTGDYLASQFVLSNVGLSHILIAYAPQIGFAAPAIGGVGAAGAKLTLSGSDLYAVGATNVAVFNGTTELGLATLNADGTWSLTATLANGTYSSLNAIATGAGSTKASAPAAFSLVVAGDIVTQTNADASKIVSTFNITGQAFTSKAIAYAAKGEIVSKLYQGVTGEGYLSAFEYFYGGGNLIGTDDFYAGFSGQDYSGEQVDYDGAGRATRAAFTGVAGAAYSAYEYDYVGGVFSGSKFTYTSVPAGASYSAYEVDYNLADAFTGDKFFFTDITGETYTGEEEDFDASGDLSRVLLTGVTGQAYSSLEEDYSAGAYAGDKAYYTGISGQTYSNEEVDVSASNQLEKVVYSGMMASPYSSVEQDYLNGALADTIYGFTDVTGQSYYAYQVEDGSNGKALTETFDLNSGAHTAIALAAGQTLTSLGLDKFTGDGATTFILNAIYGSETFTNFNAADTVSLLAREYSQLDVAIQNGSDAGGNATLTFSDGDTLTFKSTTLAALANMTTNFTTHG